MTALMVGRRDGEEYPALKEAVPLAHDLPRSDKAMF
jgi:hypothetical protein